MTEEKQLTKTLLATPRVISKTVYDGFTSSQLEEVIKREKPAAIYNGEWSQRMPFIEITEHTETGVMMFCNGLADKTPMLYSFDSLYRFLKNGMESCYILTKDNSQAIKTN